MYSYHDYGWSEIFALKKLGILIRFYLIDGGLCFYSIAILQLDNHAL